MKKQLRKQVVRFNDFIYSDVPIARQALRKLTAGPIAFSPVMRDGRKGYELKWKTKIGALLSPPYLYRSGVPTGT